MFDFNSKQKLNESNPTEISVKKKQQIEYMPLGKIFVQRGHTVFEIETTGEIREAEYQVQSSTYDLLKGIAQSKIGSLIVNKGCVYIPALNKANALKKYLKSGVQSDYYAKEAPMKLYAIKRKK
jgi:hypothetical protein